MDGRRKWRDGQDFLVQNSLPLLRFYRKESLFKSCASSFVKVQMAAPTGIASTLLIKATTLHKLFSIPLDCDANSCSRIDFESDYANVCPLICKSFLQFIRSIDVLIIDECSMISREIMHCIETCCRYLDQENRFFGGKVRNRL